MQINFILLVFGAPVHRFLPDATVNNTHEKLAFKTLQASFWILKLPGVRHFFSKKHFLWTVTIMRHYVQTV